MPAVFFFLVVFAAGFPWVLWGILTAFVNARRHCLLSVMAAAAEKNQPLDASVAAYGESYSGNVRKQAVALAHLLREGLPLGQALHKVPGLLSLHAQVAAQIGDETNNLAEALSAAKESEWGRHQQNGQVVSRIVYCCFVLMATQLLLAFVAFSILPRFKKIFADFGVELPEATLAIIRFSDATIDTGLIFISSLAFALFLLVAPAALGARIFGWPLLSFDFIENQFTRNHSGTILRCLSLCIKQGRSIPESLTMLADTYPVAKIRRRLTRTIHEVQEGVPWQVALRRNGLLAAADLALIEAAQKSKNLPWVLHEIAQSSERRFRYRLNWMLQILSPLVVLLLSLPIAFIVVALFIPVLHLTMQLGGG